MPRGFLVKRLQKHSTHVSYRVRRYSDEDRSDSSSDHDGPEGVAVSAVHASPDSGFSSPTFLLAYRPSQVTYTSEKIDESSDSGSNNDAISNHNPIGVNINHIHNNNIKKQHVHYGSGYTNTEENPQPLSLITRPDNNNCGVLSPDFRSPFYLTSFDRLAVTPTTPCKASPPEVLIVPPPSPHKKRVATSEPEQERTKAKATKKSKAVRRLNFDEDKTSPVSGTIIRELGEDEELLVVRKGDIDPSFNVVEITEEAKAEIAKIENRIGDYICQLCKTIYDDAFGLAQHRCSRIVHVEYRCPECDKVFNCPANLASHRRWHKPRTVGQSTSTNKSPLNAPPRLLPTAVHPPPHAAIDPSDTESNGSSLPCSPSPDAVDPGLHSNGICSVPTTDEYHFECLECGKKFRRKAYLRKHVATHAPHDDATTTDGKKDLRTLLDALFDKSNLATETESDRHDPLPDRRSPPSAAGGTTTADIFSCKYCSTSFSSSPGLTRHINKHHPSESRQVILLQMPSVRTGRE